MKWTPRQQEAIDTRGKNILVAAAAGSGKTAVLVERIKKLIIEDGVSIDRMLIVTFTNAAAEEMKEKIRNAIYKELEEKPDNGALLTSQLELLNRANISTFHSYALEVIRTFFYKIDVEPNFTICDNAQKEMLKQDAMAMLMEQYFEESSPEFIAFLNCYSSDRNQDKVKAMISMCYEVLMSLPYPWEWLSESVKFLKATPEEFKNSKAMDFVYDIIFEKLETAVKHMDSTTEYMTSVGLDILSGKIKQSAEEIEQIREESYHSKDFEAIGSAVSGIKFPQLRASKEEKEILAECKDTINSIYQVAKDAIKEIKTLFYSEPFDQLIAQINQCASYGETLEKLVRDYHEIFMGLKAEQNLLDFSDAEHFSLKLLQDEETAKHYRDKFEYIFIDEYQDTNILQEEIISKIKRDNNLFMVGDIKQSIYKFRLAEPEIFKRKYQDYAKDENSVKIDLNQNFRSKANVLKDINNIFEDVMEDYDEDAKLYPGVEYDGPFIYDTRSYVVDTSDYAAVSEDDEIEKLKADEAEALQVAKIIKECLGKTFFDHKAGVERTIKKKDIVVLMRSVKNHASVYYDIFKTEGIDSYIDENEGYFDTMEIEVFLNLLSVIDNKMQDVPLISVLHSEIFGFSSGELSKVRADHKEGSFASSFINYAEMGTDASLKDKCQKALDQIKAWKSLAGTMPLSKYLWHLLLETGYYLTMGAMPGGELRQANLRILVDKADSFSLDRQLSLYSFVRYINLVKEKKISSGQAKLLGEHDDLVRIMTIHKSKGLEFPVVIVAGLGRNARYTKNETGVMLHKDIGLGLHLVNYKEHWNKSTLLEKLIARQINREEYLEEVRVLYVALTRAKDMLYLTGTVRDGEKFREKLELGTTAKNNLLNMMDCIPKCSIVGAGDFVSAERGHRGKQPLMDYDFFETKATPEVKEEVYRRLNYKYPYEEDHTRKLKYSVTELNKLKVETAGQGEYYELPLAVPKFRQEEKKLTAAEKGTIYHKIMEQIDFEKAVSGGADFVNETVESMVKRELLTEKEAGSITNEPITAFFESEIGERCAKAFSEGRLQREKAFTLRLGEKGDILTQGIIDCYFREDDGFVLLDYKTNYINKSVPFEEEAERIRNTYKEQIHIYGNAISSATGIPVKEAYIYLFNVNRLLKMNI